MTPSVATGSTPPKARPRRDLVVDTGAAERFHALPPEERERILDGLQQALGRAFAATTVDDFIAEKRREAARED